MVTEGATLLHVRALHWARNLAELAPDRPKRLTFNGLRSAHESDLKMYFQLCGLSRSKSARRSLSEEATDLLFRTRTVLERGIKKDIVSLVSAGDPWVELLATHFFGTSKKQGISLRMPLTT